MQQLAESLGIDVSTVSRALNPTQTHLVASGTRQRIEEAVRLCGYRRNDVARSLRLGSSGTVGIVVADITNSFVMSAIRGVEDVLDEAGLAVIMVETRDDHNRLVRLSDRLRERRLDGVITSAARHGDASVLAQMASAAPVVLMLRTVQGLSLPAVVNDELRGGFLAAQYLIGDLGHMRIAQVVGPADISPFVGRAEGFRSAAQDQGVEVLSIPIGTESRRDSGERIARELARSENRPTAVFAPTDEIAVGMLSGFRSCGLSCPRDVSIVGYYDSPLAQIVEPQLTTIRLHSHEVGRRSAELLLEQRRGAVEAPKTLLMAPELVVRGSTMSARR